METYNGNCHCGRIQFTLSHPPLTTTRINRCNCSICTKNGYLLIYPYVKDVVFRCGEAELAQYRFGNQNKPHKFCPSCGTSVLIDFGESLFEKEREVMAINIRTIEGIEDILDELEYRAVDGKNKLGPPYIIDRAGN